MSKNCFDIKFILVDAFPPRPPTFSFAMLRYVCSQVDGEKNASEIVKSINVLMAIEWGRQAWNDVRQSTIMKCFQKTGLYPRDDPIKDNPI